MARPTFLVAVAGGSIYMGYSPTNLTLCTNSEGVLEDTPNMAMQDAPASPQDEGDAKFHRHVYFCDGASYYKLDAHTGEVSEWEAHSGQLPVDNDGNTGTIMAFYRERMVIAGLKEDPHNWFMSASGDVGDWDYSPATISSTMAVAGNVSEAGKTPDRITALCVISDDMMVIGGHRSMAVMSGDPAAGGVIDMVSNQIGIVGPDAWCLDPANTLYFVGNDGLYKFAGGQLQNISLGRLDKIFSTIDLSTFRVVMTWDRKNHGLFVFFVDDRAEDPASKDGFFWDSRTDSFWPIRIPESNGPVSVFTFDTDASEDRSVLLGGRDGYIRRFREDRLNDNDGANEDGYSVEVPIESMVDIGPIMAFAPANKSLLGNMVIVLSEDSDPVELEFHSDKTPELVVNSQSPVFSGQIEGGRSKTWRQRTSDYAFKIRLKQNALNVRFTYDSGWIEVLSKGPMWRGTKRKP